MVSLGTRFYDSTSPALAGLFFADDLRVTLSAGRAGARMVGLREWQVGRAASGPWQEIGIGFVTELEPQTITWIDRGVSAFASPTEAPRGPRAVAPRPAGVLNPPDQFPGAALAACEAPRMPARG